MPYLSYYFYGLYYIAFLKKLDYYEEYTYYSLSYDILANISSTYLYILAYRFFYFINNFLSKLYLLRV
jgi:hypothetical protein